MTSNPFPFAIDELPTFGLLRIVIMNGMISASSRIQIVENLDWEQIFAKGGWFGRGCKAHRFGLPVIDYDIEHVRHGFVHFLIAFGC
jgi:hypothetical protein